MKRSWLTIALLGASMPALAADGIALSDCRLPEFEGPARCGQLEVPENPGKPDGRRIAIAVAVLPATGGAALPDPIVPLMGGPGEDTLSAAGYVHERLGRLRRERDVVLVDQRGTGRSAVLRCRLHDPANPAPSLQHLMPPEPVARCARELSQHADLTQYSYLHFARDLEAVRKALGYGRLNLSAGSYGTRAAQVFLRAYPESVRTAFLGSVVPMDVVTPLTMAKSSQPIFEATIDACAGEPACRAAFPRLRAEFDEILERLDAGGVRVAVPGSAEAVPLARRRVVEWMRSLLYRPSGAADLPWIVHRAHEGDWSPVVEGILAQARGFDANYGGGLFLSITCAGDLAYLREDEVEPASADTFLGDYRVRQQQAACAQWPVARMPADYREPVRSPVPAMFVSGDLDPATPPAFTERVAPGFTNRVEVLARGQGHTEWSACIGDLYARFVEAGTAEGMAATACPDTPRPPFRTR